MTLCPSETDGHALISILNIITQNIHSAQPEESLQNKEAKQEQDANT
jgi:hypothetical protein